MSRRILILGIGSAQWDLFEYCRERQFEVHACSSTDCGLARKLADRFAQIDIADVEAIRRYAEASEVDLIYSVGSDLAMPTACRVSEDLGLPTLVSAEAALACNQKPRLRALLGPAFDGNLEFRAGQSVDDVRPARFPVMMKPADAQGQRGVRRVDSAAELEAHFETCRSFSRTGNVIVERYVEGPEISVNTYSIDGQIAFALVSDRISWPDLPGGIIHEHRFPSAWGEGAVGDAVLDLVARTLAALGVREGPAYFQICIKDGHPWLLEVTPRLDGCHLWRLIRYAIGVDLLDATLRHLQGEAVSGLLGADPKPAPMRLEFLCEAPGVPMNRARWRLSAPLYHQWYYEDEEMIRPINGYFEKCGYHISRFPAG